RSGNCSRTRVFTRHRRDARRWPAVRVIRGNLPIVRGLSSRLYPPPRPPVPECLDSELTAILPNRPTATTPGTPPNFRRWSGTQDDFPAALRGCGAAASDDPGLVEIVGAVTGAIDAPMPDGRGRTDLGEMAQMAAAESLTEVVGGRLAGRLFETAPE